MATSDQRRFELIEGTSSKFWEIWIEGSKVVTRYGRLGTEGQSTTKDAGSEADAKKLYDKLVKEKTGKGYREVGAAPERTEDPSADGDAGLAKLGAVLVDLGEIVGKKERHPVTSKQLAAIEKALGRVPEELRALYTFGGNLRSVIGSVEGLDWCDVDGALAELETNRKHAKAPTSLFPIATDGAGNSSCFDAATGRIVSWDHETRKASSVAPSLAAYLSKDVLPVLKRDAREAKALAKEKGGGPAPAKSLEPGRLPSKLVRVPNAILAKLDRASYGGGVRDARFLDDDTVVLGFQNNAEIVTLSSQAQVAVEGGGDAVAYDERTGQILLAQWGALTLVDAKRREIVARWQAGVRHGACLRLAPDRSMALVCSSDGVVELWDLASREGIPMEAPQPFMPTYQLPKGTPIASLQGHDGRVTCASFGPDGKLVVTGDLGGNLCIWNVAERSLVKRVAVAPGAIYGVDVGPDGETIFVGFESGDVRVLDAGGAELRRWKAEHGVMDLRLVAKGVLATLGWNALSLWDASNGESLATLARKEGEAAPRIADVRGGLLLTVGPLAIVRMA